MSDKNNDKEPLKKEAPKEDKPANVDATAHSQEDNEGPANSLTLINPYNYPKPPTNLPDKPAFLFKPGILEPKPSQDTTKPVPASLDPGPSSSSTMVPRKLDQPQQHPLGVDHPLFVAWQVNLEEPFHIQNVIPAKEHPLGPDKPGPAEEHPHGVDQPVLAENHPHGVDQHIPAEEHPPGVDQPDHDPMDAFLDYLIGLRYAGPADEHPHDVDQPVPADDHPNGVDQPAPAEDHPHGVDQPDPEEDHPLDVDQPGSAEDHPLGVDHHDHAEDHPLGVDQPDPAEDYPLDVDQTGPAEDHPPGADQPDLAEEHSLGVDQPDPAKDHPPSFDQPDAAEDHPPGVAQHVFAEDHAFLDYLFGLPHPGPAEGNSLDIDPAYDQPEASTSIVNDQAVDDIDDEPNPLIELADTHLQCPICMEVYIMATSTNCGHTFCQDCIVDWRKKNKLCPVCRTRIKHMAPSTALDQFITEMFGMMDQEGLQRRREFVLERRQKREHCGKKKK